MHVCMPSCPPETVDFCSGAAIKYLSCRQPSSRVNGPPSRAFPSPRDLPRAMLDGSSCRALIDYLPIRISLHVLYVILPHKSSAVLCKLIHYSPAVILCFSNGILTTFFCNVINFSVFAFQLDTFIFHCDSNKEGIYNVCWQLCETGGHKTKHSPQRP